MKYIEDQKEQHKSKLFYDGYNELLKKQTLVQPLQPSLKLRPAGDKLGVVVLESS